MKKNTKRGFTIVELVIVIAVIAILAGVLIPIFSNLIRRANISADTQLVKNLNTLLTINETTDGKNVTPTDAINDVYEGGYRIEKLTPTTRGYDIMWDSVNDRFILLDDNTTNKAVVYGTEETKNLISDTTKRYKLFAIRSNNDDDIKNVYSLYLTGNSTIPSVTTSKGLDVGKNTVNSINYTNGSTQNVIIRTSGGTLNINAEHDTIAHYGYSEEVNITAVADASFDEFGTSSFVEIAKGHIEVQNTGIINIVVATSNDVKVDVVDNAIIGQAFSTVTVTAQTGNQTLTVLTAEGSATPLTGEALTTAIQEKKENSSFRGEGTEANPYLISNANELRLMSLKINTEIETGEYKFHRGYYKLTSDINISSQDWTPIATDSRPFTGVLDGNDKIINGLTINSENNNVGLFAYVSGATIKNLTLASVNIKAKETVGAFIGKSTIDLVTIINCTVDSASIINGTKKVGGFIGNAFGEVSFSDCEFYGKVDNSGSYAGGFIGRLFDSTRFDGSYGTTSFNGRFENCKNNGTIIANAYSAGFIGHVNTNFNPQNVSQTSVVEFISCESTVAENQSSYIGYTACVIVSLTSCKANSTLISQLSTKVIEEAQTNNSIPAITVVGLNGAFYVTKNISSVDYTSTMNATENYSSKTDLSSKWYRINGMSIVAGTPTVGN